MNLSQASRLQQKGNSQTRNNKGRGKIFINTYQDELETRSRSNSVCQFKYMNGKDATNVHGTSKRCTQPKKTVKKKQQQQRSQTQNEEGEKN